MTRSGLARANISKFSKATTPYIDMKFVKVGAAVAFYQGGIKSRTSHAIEGKWKGEDSERGRFEFKDLNLFGHLYMEQNENEY